MSVQTASTNKSFTTWFSWIVAIIIMFSIAAGITFLYGNPLGADFGTWKKALELLTGFWLFFAMFFCALLALRIPSVNRLLKGLPNAYKWHKDLGITVCVLLALHWLVAKGPKWASQLGLIELVKKKKAIVEDPQWWEQIFKLLKDSGEWIGYAMIILLALALFGKFLRQNSWVKFHRLFGLAILLGAFHGIGSFPSKLLNSWPQWICVLCGFAAIYVVIQELKLDLDKGLLGKVLAQSKLSGDITEITVETAAKLKILPAQFISISFDTKEHPHPFTVISSKTENDKCVFSIWIKDLGKYSHELQTRKLIGAEAFIHGPYGEFLAYCDPNDKMVWIAAGVGITPFVSKLQDKTDYPATTLIWSYRGLSESLVDRVRNLAKSSNVKFLGFDSSKGQSLRDSKALSSVLKPFSDASFYYCGTPSFKKNLDSFLKTISKTESDSENFSWR